MELVRRIPLKNGGSALVDAADFDELARYTWTNDGRGYAARSIRTVFGAGGKPKKAVIYMHRQIMRAPPHLYVDHANHDTLDNRRRNLRLATNSENQANRLRWLGGVHSAFKGVTRHAGGRWQAQLKCQGVNCYLGLHDTPEEAARAYDDAARLIFGPFACCNFPLPVEAARAVRLAA